MKMKVFSVLDAKAGFYGQPYFEQQEASAIRAFGDAVNDSSNPNNQWNKHPEDFSLYLIGEYDNETGEIFPVKLEALVNASSLYRHDVRENRSVKEPQLIN